MPVEESRSWGQNTVEKLEKEKPEVSEKEYIEVRELGGQGEKQWMYNLTTKEKQMKTFYFHLSNWQGF